jgi:hypothetical protein
MHDVKTTDRRYHAPKSTDCPNSFLTSSERGRNSEKPRNRPWSPRRLRGRSRNQAPAVFPELPGDLRVSAQRRGRRVDRLHVRVRIAPSGDDLHLAPGTRGRERHFARESPRTTKECPAKPRRGRRAGAERRRELDSVCLHDVSWGNDDADTADQTFTCMRADHRSIQRDICRRGEFRRNQESGIRNQAGGGRPRLARHGGGRGRSGVRRRSP